MKTYEDILRYIGYPTINRLFELEHSELSDFVERGVAYIISGKLNLKCLTSTGLVFSKIGDNETVVKLYSKFEYIKDKEVENIIDLGDFIKVKLLEQRINVSSSKILYVEISKKLINYT